MRDNDWGVMAPWGSAVVLIRLTKIHHDLQKLCRCVGLFESILNPREILQIGIL